MTRCRAAALALALSYVTPAIAADSQTVIVFDGSGSMWGRMEGDKRTKLDAARETLKAALGKVRPEARLGLTTFGYRRKGDCSDIEVVVPVEAQSAEKISGLVDKWNPKGKGPLANTLREVAKTLPTDTPANMIAVVDGVDNCQQDACVAASDLAKSHPGLKIHIVGLSLEKDDAAKLQCAALPSGGYFADARDGATLEAAIDETFKLANLDTSSPVDPAGTRDPVASQSSPAGSPGLRLKATLSAKTDGPPVAVAWRIAEAATDKIVFEGTARYVDLDSAPGAYKVRLRIGTIAAEEKVEVTEKGRTVVALALDAGTLKMKARAGVNDTHDGTTLFTVAADDGKASAMAAPVWIGRAGDSGLVLPAGVYQVRAENGQVTKTATLTVEAGAEQVFASDLNSGRLELALAARENGETLSGAVFIIERDDTDAPQGRREVARSAAPQPDFMLASGTYYVIAELGGASIRERIAVGSGNVVKRTLVMPVQHVTIEAALNRSPVPENAGLEVRVIRTEATPNGTPREIERTFGRGTSLNLAQGKYLIEGRIGQQNVRIGQELVINESGTKKVVLNLEAGELILTSHAEGRMEVRDADGARVWYATGANARALLAPGRYTVKTESDQGSKDQVIELKAGEQRTVDIGGP